MKSFLCADLRLLTYVRFFRQNGLILSEVFCIWKKQESRKKNMSEPWKKFTFLKGFDSKNTIYEISKNLIQKACFQMTQNAKNIISP